MGFHPTGTCGLFGATATVGKLRGLTVNQLENAFGINGSQASGSMQYDANGAWNKRAHPGFANHSAFIATTLAYNEFLGAVDPIEGKDGFLQGYSLRPQPERALQGLGDQFETLNVAIKPYPLCRYTHMTLYQLITLATDENIHSTSVHDIHIELPTYGVNLVGTPIDAKREAKSAVDAQFSAPFAAALALTRREAGMDTFRNVVDKGVDEKMRRLMSRTTVGAAADLDAIHPERWPGRVTLQVDNREITRYGEHVKGEPENPMTWEDMKGKFAELSPTHSDPARDQVLKAIENAEGSTVDDIVSPLR